MLTPTRITALMALGLLSAAPFTLCAEDLGPFQWARLLLDADPALVTPTDTAANGLVESATILGQESGTTKIRLVQWVGANQGGTKSYSKNTLRGVPGQSLAVGLAGWKNTEALNTGEGFVEVSRLQQDAKILMGFVGANQSPSLLVHGATPGIDGVLSSPAIIVSLVFRRVQGSGLSAWQTSWCSGNPLQIGVWQVAAGQSLSQAQANQANCLSNIKVLTEITPDSPFLSELKVRPDGSWQLSLDLNADGVVDKDLVSGVDGAKVATVGSVDQSGGLWITASPVYSVAAGAVGITSIDLATRAGEGWVDSLRDRRPLRMETNFASRVSPAVIQGNAWLASMNVSVTPNVGFDRLNGGLFTARVALDPQTEGATAVVTQSSTTATQLPISIRWIATSILSGGTYTIKKGDSLLLSADDGYQVPSRILINPGQGQGLTQTARQVATYNQVGTYTAQAWDDKNGDGQDSADELLGTITINVVDLVVPTYIPDRVNYARSFQLDTGNLPASSVRLKAATGQALTVGTLEAVGTTLKTTLKPTANTEPVLSVSTADGVLLASRPISTFLFSVPTGSVIPVKHTYPNGSVLLGGQLRMEPLRPNLDIAMQIFVTGAAFTDGGLKLVLPSNGFTKDSTTAVGTMAYDIYRSASSGTGACHTITIWHGTTKVSE